MATHGKVKGIIGNLVILETDGKVAQNEICMIQHSDAQLKAEVIRIDGNRAFVQVFESTRGLKIDTGAEFLGNMLEATLGPGILSRNYDGLQNDLDAMEGIFLKRGDYTKPLDEEKLWAFTPLVTEGDTVTAGCGSVR